MSREGVSKLLQVPALARSKGEVVGLPNYSCGEQRMYHSRCWSAAIVSASHRDPTAPAVTRCKPAHVGGEGACVGGGFEPEAVAPQRDLASQSTVPNGKIVFRILRLAQGSTACPPVGGVGLDYTGAQRPKFGKEVKVASPWSVVGATMA